MKIILLLCLLSLILYINCARPTKVIQIMSWDPLHEKTAQSDELPENFKGKLRDAFDYGKTLVEGDQVGFYDKLQQEEVKFFSPSTFNSWAPLYAFYEGLFSKESGQTPKKTLENIADLKLKKIGEEDDGVYTIDAGRDLENSFRVIESSILLEGSSFDCSNKQKLILKNKQEIPSHVKKTCNSATEGGDGESLVKIQDAMDLYKKGTRSRDLSLESCLEQFTFATYYSNDLLIKLNAGELLSELVQILSSNDKDTKLYSYMIPGEAFLAVLTAVQKAALAQIRGGSYSLSQRLYWGSLKNFDKRILIELFSEEQGENDGLRIAVQSDNNQLLFKMDIALSKFIREVGPFMVTDYMNFKTLCSSEALPAIDLRKIMLPEDSFFSLTGLKPVLLVLLLLVSVVIALLAINYKNLTRKRASTKKDTIEFKRIQTDENDQESGIRIGGGEIKYRKNIDESYGV